MEQQYGTLIGKKILINWNLSNVGLNLSNEGIESLKGYTYEQRLEKLKLPTLKGRRRRGDLIQMYKMNNRIDLINLHHPPDEFQTIRESRRRSFSIRRQLTKTRHRYHYFTNRVAKNWNCLTQKIVDLKNTNLFKNGIDKYFGFNI